ncbi:MAG: hypothetical protein MJ211_06535 [Bacteroidales bacterium]|nr:hypothetical protein [Bacteroidales bacterium]
MDFSNLNLFSDRGGQFLIPLSDFISKVSKIKCLIFDWDGVFNSGVKGDGVYSCFSEVDSMGLNILRFGYKLKFNEILLAGIISGEKNPSTEKFVNREHLNFKCLGFKDKIEGFNYVLKQYSLIPEQVAFVFDDILDLSLAEKCGLRFQINRLATPMFNNYVKNNNLADYVSANCGDKFAVREISELMLASIDVYNQAVKSRTKFDEKYSEYISQRNSIQPITFSPNVTY